MALDPDSIVYLYVIGQYGHSTTGGVEWGVAMYDFTGVVRDYVNVTAPLTHEPAFMVVDDPSNTVMLGWKNDSIGSYNDLNTKAPFNIMKFERKSQYDLELVSQVIVDIGEVSSYLWETASSKLFLLTLQGQIVSVDTLGDMSYNGIMTVYVTDDIGSADRGNVAYLQSGAFYNSGSAFMGTEWWGLLIRFVPSRFCVDDNTDCLTLDSKLLTDIELALIVIMSVVLVAVAALVAIIIIIRVRRGRYARYRESSTLLDDAPERKPKGNPFKMPEDASWAPAESSSASSS